MASCDRHIAFFVLLFSVLGQRLLDAKQDFVDSVIVKPNCLFATVAREVTRGVWCVAKEKQLLMQQII